MEVKFHIKGMVCDRCITAVKQALISLGFEVLGIRLGEVSIQTSNKRLNLKGIEEALKLLGLSLVENKQTKLIEQVKEIVTHVYNGEFDFPHMFRLSTVLQERLLKDYDTISSLFSTLEGTTIERYVINYRLDKAKELLLYSDHTLNEIAFKLGYSSVAHLSKQFKDITGLNASYFKTIKQNKARFEYAA